MAVVVVVAAMGATKLDYPLIGDQTLFAMGAQVISDGGVLYRDFWDIKPPGIFLWFLAAGELFGFSDFGVRIFDILYQCTFAALMVWMLSPLVGGRTAALAALLTVGWYYAFCEHLLFVEPLVQLPLFLTLAGVTRAHSSRNSSVWFLAAGAGTGLATLFKPVLGLVGLGVWLAGARGRRGWLPAALGAAIPVSVTLTWFAAHAPFRLSRY
ncbi:MAG: glycosyltransferase family 39 protein [Bryobacterales bacterium]|nr:glycosyltransferase family 39 protein [Bryobacterales bacterium]